MILFQGPLLWIDESSRHWHTKKLLVALQCRLREIVFLDLVILAEYLAYALISVSSNPSVGSSPRTRISFFLLLVCTVKLLSTPKITIFLPHSPVGNETCEPASNPIL